MKVTQERNFDPVIITLESYEELEGLWNILNCGPSYTLKSYTTNCPVGQGVQIIKIKDDLRAKLHSILFLSR